MYIFPARTTAPIHTSNADAVRRPPHPDDFDVEPNEPDVAGNEDENVELVYWRQLIELVDLERDNAELRRRLDDCQHRISEMSITIAHLQRRNKAGTS